VAALVTLGLLKQEHLVERAKTAGASWMDRIRAKTNALGVRDVRGQGLMVGVELEGGAARGLTVTRRLLGRGWIVLTGGMSGDALTLTPPLDTAGALLDAFVDALADALRA
jgi:4-aminobutyrate aminotransferase-like enzyme